MVRYSNNGGEKDMEKMVIMATVAGLIGAASAVQPFVQPMLFH